MVTALSSSSECLLPGGFVNWNSNFAVQNASPSPRTARNNNQQQQQANNASPAMPQNFSELFKMGRPDASGLGKAKQEVILK